MIDATILPVSFRAVDVAHFAAKIIVPEINIRPARLSPEYAQSRQTRVHSGAAADGNLPESIVAAATTDAIHLGAISSDAVKQLVIAKVERRPARLDLDDYPYLPVANVKTTSAADYAVLVSGRAA